MSPARKAIIFDWNGTLLADTSLCLRATNETLAVFNVKPITLKQYREEYTVPLHHMYKAFGCDEKEMFARQEELFDVFAKHYESSAPRLRPRRGAKQTLEAIKAVGHKTAVLSNYTVEKISKQAKRLGLLEQFDAVLANDSGVEVFRTGGKGARLRHFIDAHETQKAIIVGDTVEEVEIAQHYGYVSVAIADGVCSLARLRAARPDYLIRSLEEIPTIAQKVFERKDR